MVEPTKSEKIQELVDIFIQIKLKDYIDAIRKQKISVDVLLTMTKDEIKETLDIDSFGHLRILELMLDNLYKDKHSWNGRIDDYNYDEKDINGNGNDDDNNNNDGKHYNNNANESINETGLLMDEDTFDGVKDYNKTPDEIIDEGNGQWVLISTNPKAWFGLLLIGCSIGMSITMGIIGGSESANILMFIIPVLFFIWGLVITNMGKIFGKFVTRFDDEKRTVSVNSISLLTCITNKVVNVSYDDISGFHIVKTSFTSNRVPVKSVELMIKGGQRLVRVGTIETWKIEHTQWQNWLTNRITEAK